MVVSGETVIRVLDHATLVLLDASHLAGLLRGRHVLVDDAEPSRLRHGDGEARLGDGIHRGRDERDVEDQLTGEAGAEPGLSGQDVREGGDEEHIVKGQAFLDLEHARGTSGIESADSTPRAFAGKLEGRARPPAISGSIVIQSTVLEAPMRDIYTVSRLNLEARRLVEARFPPLWVEGELSNLARPRSGHLYFSLKDERCQVRCAMFRMQNRYLDFDPVNGMQVLAQVRVSLYPERGEFQLIVQYLEEAGAGALRRAFEALKRRLEGEGLFDDEGKRPIPKVPACIGILTSPTGAALRDILTVMRRRYPGVHAILYPVPVQGEGAAGRIAEMVDRAAARAECDVLVLARGGGSLEDLWCFNEEPVARAIHRCPIPIVTGIGHEVDFTIADLVADRRAPTPSAAAELVTPDAMQWRDAILRARLRLGTPDAAPDRGAPGTGQVAAARAARSPAPPPGPLATPGRAGRENAACGAAHARSQSRPASLPLRPTQSAGTGHRGPGQPDSRGSARGAPPEEHEPPPREAPGPVADPQPRARRGGAPADPRPGLRDRLAPARREGAARCIPGRAG